MAAPRRNRRARRAGNPAELMPLAWPIVARDTNRVPGVPSEGEGGGERFPNWVRRKLTRTALVLSDDQVQLGPPGCLQAAVCMESIRWFVISSLLVHL